MHLRSWHLATAGLLPPMASGLYLLLAAPILLLAHGLAAGPAVVLGLAGFALLLTAVVAGLTPVPLLAFAKTRWLGALLAVAVALGLLTVAGIEGLPLGWERWALVPAAIGLLAAAGWTLLEDRGGLLVGHATSKARHKARAERR